MTYSVFQSTYVTIKNMKKKQTYMKYMCLIYVFVPATADRDGTTGGDQWLWPSLTQQSCTLCYRTQYSLPWLYRWLSSPEDTVLTSGQVLTGLHSDWQRGQSSLLLLTSLFLLLLPLVPLLLLLLSVGSYWPITSHSHWLAVAILSLTWFNNEEYLRISYLKNDCLINVFFLWRIPVFYVEHKLK